MVKKLPYMLLTLLLIASAVLTGCGNELTIEEVNERAQKTMESLKSYRLEISGTQTEDDETDEMSAMIEIVAPDRMRTVQPGSSMEETLMIGRTQYNRYVGNDYWNVRKWPVSTTMNQMDAYTGLLGTLEGLEELSDEIIDGVSCTHYSGSVDMSARGEEEKDKLDPSDDFYEQRLESLSVYENWDLTVEVWVEKSTYRIRQIRQKQELITSEALDGDDEQHSYLIDVTFRFYDFNADIEIEEPPSLSVKGVNLAHSSVSSVGGTDIARQKIKYEITIENRASGTAHNLRVFVDSEATDDGKQTFEATSVPMPVDLGTDDTVTYVLEWEYDMTGTSKEELVEKMSTNVIRATWDGDDGNKYEEILFIGRGSE